MKRLNWLKSCCRTLRAFAVGCLSPVGVLSALAVLVLGAGPAQATVVQSGPTAIAGTSDKYVKFTLSDNTTASKTWKVPDNVTSIQYLVVGGGGAGGGRYGGGGGGGGVMVGTATVTASSELTITVGKGGDATTAATTAAAGGSGDASSITLDLSNQVVAKGGGGGAASGSQYSSAGGSGGGGAYSREAGGDADAGSGSGIFESESEGHANKGGKGGSTSSYPHGAGGGGASVAAADVGSSATQGTDGGEGWTSDITGTDEVYGSGGGGGSKSSGQAKGGTNAGNGGINTSGAQNGGAGVDGFGGGGGGAYTQSYTSGRGGSGTVIIRYSEGGTPSPTPSGSDVVPETLPASQGYSLMAVENGTAYCVQVFTNTTAEINWPVPANVNSIDYLVVGGGGGGGSSCNTTRFGGSGGGGCVKSGNNLGVTTGAQLTINVGSGGDGALGGTSRDAGGNGVQSSLKVGSTTYVALGGGGGGSYAAASSTTQDGASAGTGGGATSWGKSSAGKGTGDGHGGNGGTGNEQTQPFYGGGGGGASTTAGNASGATPGAGVVSAITGESIEYGRGGEGPEQNKVDFKGVVRNGLGEGGRGSNYRGNQVAGAKGSDGVVIVRYAIGSGSVIGSNGYEYEYSKDGKSYHVCVYTNTSGSTTWNKPSGVTSLDYLVVGGGASGGGGVGGGGGAGGFVTGTLSSGLANSYSITVGKGAAGAGLIGRYRYGPVGSDGTSSYFGSVEAKGGGGGGAYGNGGNGGGATTCPGRPGASGGGASSDVICDGGSGTDGQGYKGGNSTVSDHGTGGGGGAGSAGQNGDGTKSGYGGNGKSSDITGVMRQYAGGGGGCGGTGVSPGVGQSGGGDGGYYDKGGDGFPATTPGSGGGGGAEYFAGGSGADGVVILRYEVATTYTVTLDRQGGGQGTTSVTATPGQMLPDITRPVRDGYTFGGYFTQTGGAGTQYIDHNGTGVKEWDLTADTTLYAKWTANKHDIEYELDGGTNASGNPTKGTFDEVVTVKAPTKTGYTFAGWKVYAKYEYDYRDMLTNRYAKWGKTSPPTTDVTYSWESSPSVCVNGATGDVHFKSLTRQSNGKVTLYAQWTAVDYTITVDPNGGTGGSSTPAKYNISASAQTATLTQPTAPTGKHFGSWTVSGGSTSISGNTLTIKANSTGNITVKANWNTDISLPAQSVTLTYNGSSQTVTLSPTAEAGHYTLGGTTSGMIADSYNATATPASGYCWSDGTTSAKTITWSIGTATISSVTLAPTSATYDGSAHQPTVSKVTANGKDYSTASTGWDVTYKRGSSTTTDFTSAGTITVTVTGKTNLSGSKSVDFTIGPKSISGGTSKDLYYRGYEYGSYVGDVPFSVGGKWLDPENEYSYVVVSGGDVHGHITGIGTYSVTFTGKGNYTGTCTREVKILKNVFTWNTNSNGAWTGTGENWTCNAEEVEPGWMEANECQYPNGEEFEVNILRSVTVTVDDVIDCRLVTLDNSARLKSFGKDGPPLITPRIYFNGTASGTQTYVMEDVFILNTGATDDNLVLTVGTAGEGGSGANATVKFTGDCLFDSGDGLAYLQFFDGSANCKFLFEDCEAYIPVGITVDRQTSTATVARNLEFNNALVSATYCGCDDDRDPFCFSFTLGDKNEADGTPALDLSDTLYLRSGSKLTVDAGGKDVGTYPLVRAGAVDAPGITLDQFIATANTVSDTKPGTYAKVVATSDGKGIDLVVYNTVAKPTVTTSFTYDGNQKTAGSAATGYTVSGNTGTNAGNYTFKATLKSGYCWSDDHSTSDYSVGWTINKAAAPTITVTGYSAKYDGASHDAVSVSGQKSGSTTSYSTDGSSWVTTMPTVRNVSDTKTIYVKVTNQNYNDATGNATATVSKRSVTLTSATASKTYDGTALTAKTVTPSGDGFVSGEGATYSVTGTQTNAGSSSNAFTYTLNSGTTAGNYTITTTAGTLTVNAKTLTDAMVTVSPTSKTYNGASQKPEVTVTDSAATITTGDYTITNNGGTNVGKYSVTVEGKGNYTGTVTKENCFEITKAMLTATADNKSVTYGDEAPTYTVTVTGFVNGETAATAAGYTDPTATSTYTKTTGAGSVSITVTGGAASNYTFSYTPGTLTVNKRTISINWTNRSFVYDGLAHKPTATAGNVVNSDTVALTVSGEQTEVGSYTATAAFAATQANYELPSDKTTTFTITKPVYTVNGGQQIEVDPTEMKKLFGETVSNWQTALTTANANGVSGWVAYVLGAQTATEVTNFALNLMGGSGTAANKITLKFMDGSLPDATKRRLATDDQKGVSAVKFQLYASDTQGGTYAKEGASQEASTYVLDLSGMANNSARFFKVMPVFTFINQ